MIVIISDGTNCVWHCVVPSQHFMCVHCKPQEKFVMDFVIVNAHGTVFLSSSWSQPVSVLYYPNKTLVEHTVLRY